MQPSVQLQNQCFNQIHKTKIELKEFETLQLLKIRQYLDLIMAANVMNTDILTNQCNQNTQRCSRYVSIDKWTGNLNNLCLLTNSKSCDTASLNHFQVFTLFEAAAKKRKRKKKQHNDKYEFFSENGKLLKCFFSWLDLFVLNSQFFSKMKCNKY